MIFFSINSFTSSLISWAYCSFQTQHRITTTKYAVNQFGLKIFLDHLCFFSFSSNSKQLFYLCTLPVNANALNLMQFEIILAFLNENKQWNSQFDFFLVWKLSFLNYFTIFTNIKLKISRKCKKVILFLAQYTKLYNINIFLNIKKVIAHQVRMVTNWIS